MAVAPVLTYTITFNGKPIALSSNVRASFSPGFNKIDVIYNTDISLSKYEVRVTAADAEYGVGIGKLVYYCYGSLQANINQGYIIEINNTNFDLGDITYRISMYAQNAIDKTWDATTFLVTTNGDIITDKFENPFEVYVQGDPA